MAGDLKCQCSVAQRFAANLLSHQNTRASLVASNNVWRQRGEEDILYDTQKMNPSSSESDDDNGDSPEEEEKVNDSLFQQSQAQFQSVDATSDDSDIQSQSLLK